jgi:predicted GIY-YIG superfamily endonuclease
LFSFVIASAAKQSSEHSGSVHLGEQAQWDAVHGRYVQSGSSHLAASRRSDRRLAHQAYGCKLLVWFEVHATMPDAIMREKQIKGDSRAKKIALIEEMNPDWRDLFSEITQ